MLLKDYYNILQLPPQATLPEIKQAYRRLAMIYHPDKNKNDPYADARFTEIKEAYEVLTSPVKKETWLQERWYNQSIGKKRTGEAITPVSILKLSLELEKYVSKLDVNRMNKEGLADYIHELFSTDTIEKLKQFNEPDINRQIITTVLTAMKPLPLKFARQLSNRFEALAGYDEIALQRIKDFLEQQRKSFLWDKYTAFVIIILT
jgi:molecular chaperone DnaJ